MSKSDFDGTSLLIVTTPPGCVAEWDWVLSVVLTDWFGLSFRREVKVDAKHVTLAPAQSANDIKPLVLGAAFWLQQADHIEGYCAPMVPLATWRPQLRDQRKVLVEPVIPVLFGSAQYSDIQIDVF